MPPFVKSPKWSMDLEQNFPIDPLLPGEERRMQMGEIFQHAPEARLTFKYYGQRVFEIKGKQVDDASPVLILAYKENKLHVQQMVEDANDAAKLREEVFFLRNRVAHLEMLGRADHYHGAPDRSIHTCNCEERGWNAGVKVMRRG